MRRFVRRYDPNTSVHVITPNRAAVITDNTGKEIPTIASYWFAWYKCKNATKVAFLLAIWREGGIQILAFKLY